MSSFFEKLAARLTSRRAKAVAGFDDLVRATVDDKPPSVEQAEAVLAAAGKTMEDLATAVERIKSRRVAAAAMERARAAEQELRAVQAKVDATHVAYKVAVEKLHQEHSAFVMELDGRACKLKAEIDAGQRGEQLLRDTANEPVELGALRQQLAEARRERDNFHQLANKFHQAAREAAVSASAQGYSDGYRLGYRKEAEGKRAAADEYERNAAPFVDECRRLEREIEKVQNQALTP